VRLGGGQFGRRGRQRVGNEQGLRWQLGTRTGRGIGGALQALVDDALVGRVHVHHHQAARVLGQHVGAPDLRHGAAQGLLGGRRGLGGRRQGLRQRAQRRGPVRAGLGGLQRAATGIGPGQRRLPRRAGGRCGRRAGHGVGLRHRRGHCRRGTGGGQRLHHRLAHRLEHGAPVAEAHLCLGRVHIDVHQFRLDREEQHPGRLPGAMELVVVGGAHGVAD
jgi:hypothetical protein